jgi:hypothetical protein
MKEFSNLVHAGPAAPPGAWEPVTHPPEPYDLLMLKLADGVTLRGTWTGKFWWGYDRAAQRSRPLQPKSFINFF